MHLGEVEQLRFEVDFDNSEQNPFNPNPEEWVTWGDQTWEENGGRLFEVSSPREESGSEEHKRKSAEAQAERDKEVDDYVTKCLARLDRNRDGRIARDETPIVVKYFSFRRMDKDRDGYVTRDEIRLTAEELPALAGLVNDVWSLAILRRRMSSHRCFFQNCPAARIETSRGSDFPSFPKPHLQNRWQHATPTFAEPRQTIPVLNE